MTSRSAKVYKILINDADLIFHALENISSDNDQEFPRTENIRKLADGSIKGRIWITRPNMGNMSCEFLFRTKTNKVYLLGIADARDGAYPVLNNLQRLERNITELTITNRQLVDEVRRKLTRINNRNFIKKISLEFGIDGIRYHNNTNLYRLDYELIQNTCGSTHVSFDEFVNAAQTAKVRFGIFEFGVVTRTGKRDNPASMNMRTDFAISFYFDIGDSDWYYILDYLTSDF